MSSSAGPTEPLGESERQAVSAEADSRRWAYVGVGCFTLIAGFAAGGMIGVLIAKIVGALQRCPSEPETGAPCSWLTYAFFGAVLGAISLSSIALWRLRRSEPKSTVRAD
jgi:F0F1-type ATP synthase membrane subunit c/vacuolar-type H+-ATPase subunit K